MKHLHEKSGQYFEVGSYISPDDNKTYDMTIISYWKDPETQAIGSPVELIGYYFGDYDEHATNYYIDQWIANREKEKRVLNATKKYIRDYWTVDREFLEESKVEEMELAMVECDELLQDRSWFLEDNLPPAFLMKRAEYLRYIEVLADLGHISDRGLDELKELAINFEE